ncbi:MAG: glucose-6-phosphate isomerase [Actinomycetota bacterium]|nr:glucose-6-phosphate isomerase [Actinomycetota bacterium]
MVDSIDPTQVPAWNELRTRAESMSTVRELLDTPRDFLRTHAAGLSFDFSRQRIDGATLDLLVALANELQVELLRDSMFAGDHINTTEDRAVLHTALRLPFQAELSVDGQDVVGDVHDTLNRMRVCAESVRNGDWRGADGRAITDVVNIGIGGSDLGPAMAYRALRPYRQPGLRCHFVSNVDPADIASVLGDLDPATTLFIVASKTFTTQETMANARYARTWLTGVLGEDAVARHFVAVSTNQPAVVEFGIEASNMFGFWDWVGGRYSMTSAIGLSTLIAIGPVNFRAMLDGFAAMDEHFRTAPPARNVPMLMGLIAVWNRNFLDIPTTAVLPYSNDLSRFPAYLQQLTMESNGKSVRRDGSTVNYATGGIVWGEPGTNGQHSFYQLLHQGTDDVAADIIVVANPGPGSDAAHAAQHEMLVANALAQAAVLSCGVTEIELRQAGTTEDLVTHKVMPGNRPTTVVMVPDLTPFALGALIAAYEHSVFVQGAIWQINSFDQWGVELGKKVATGILRDIEADNTEDPDLDPATRASLTEYLGLRSEKR